MFPNVKATEQVAVLGAINPASQAAGSVASGWIPAANFQKFLALVQVGVFGASATVDANIQQATSAAGAGAKAIGAGRAITQALAGGGNNVQAEINLDAQELDVANGFAFIQLTITVGTAATLVAGAVLGFNPRFAPASDFNTAAVVQIVG
jgi:hypothetical protein